MRVIVKNHFQISRWPGSCSEWRITRHYYGVCVRAGKLMIQIGSW